MTHSIDAVDNYAEQNKFLSALQVLKEDYRLYLLLLPMLLWFGFWFYKPLAGLLIAFKNYQSNLGVMESDFVGFANYFSLVNGTFAPQDITSNPESIN